MFNPVAPDQYLLHNVYLSVADIANKDLFACGCRTCISLNNAHFYEEQCQPSSRSAWLAYQKTVNRTPIAGGGRGRNNLHSGLANRCDISTLYRQCRLEPNSLSLYACLARAGLMDYYFVCVIINIAFFVNKLRNGMGIMPNSYF